MKKTVETKRTVSEQAEKMAKQVFAHPELKEKDFYRDDEYLRFRFSNGKNIDIGYSMDSGSNIAVATFIDLDNNVVERYCTYEVSDDGILDLIEWLLNDLDDDSVLGNFLLLHNGIMMIDKA